MSSPAPESPSVRRSFSAFFSLARFGVFVEILLIFGVYCAYGAWPVPDVNEQYYVGKAIHFWNPDWLGHDEFLNTPDSHWFFYAAFGLLSFAFSGDALVWAGRVLIWFATACAWRRLSWALLPKRWLAPLTAAAFAFYLESFHLAGEWIFGGVEGKGFAFPFVFWGLANFVEGKYNRAWILYGIASAFHVLVGGWVVLASLFAWSLAARVEYGATRKTETEKRGFAERISRRIRGFLAAFRRTLPGLLVGGAISLFGLIPALRLDAGATAEIIRESRQIYVFERLSHHLVASSLPWTFLTRFALLTLAFGIVVALTAALKRRDETSCKEESARFFRAETFVFGAIFFAIIGLIFDFGAKYWFENPRDAARFLRYYWFRLSDWAVPFGLVFGAARLGLLVFDGKKTPRPVENAQVANESAERKLASAATWTAFGLVVYWLFRNEFFQIASRTAAAQATDGLIPLPKPTESVAFLATLDLFGALFLIGALIFATFRSRLKTRLAPFAATGLAVWLAVLFVVAPGWRLATFVDLRGTKVIPRSAPPKESIADGWLDVCRWVRENTPEKAVFLAPRGCDSFKWEARRAEVGSWKEIPQDARSIVRWYRKMERFYATGPKDSPTRWNQPLIVAFLNKGRAAVLKESEKYGYDYAIVENPPYMITAIPEANRRFQEFVDGDLVYKNDQFVVFKFNKNDEKTPENAE